MGQEAANYLATSVKHFLKKLFQNFGESGFAYAVLRNYEGLPESIDHDLDLLVSDLRLFEGAVRNAAEGGDWTLVRKVQRYAFMSVFCVRPDAADFPVVQVDAWSPFTWKGMVLISPEVLRHRHQHPNGFDILSPGAEAAVSLIKNLIYHEKVQEKYKPLIPAMARGDRGGFFQALEGPFGAALTRRLYDLAGRGDWAGIEALAGELRCTLALRAVRRQPLTQLGRWLAFLWGHGAKFFQPTGMFVVLIGPDGSGKSTVAQGLQVFMKRLFAGVRYYHGHFEILPRLRDLAGRLGLMGATRSEGPGPISSTPASKGRRFGLLRSAVYLSYYGMDYLLGHLIIFWARGRGQLVIFDRYYYDYVIQPGMSLPQGLIFALLKLVPAPDAVIYLKNDPETILSRKPELTRQELERQGWVCGRLMDRFGHGCVVETTGTPGETVSRVGRVIAARLAQSTAASV